MSQFPLDDDLIRRFWKYVIRTDACWQWTASAGSHGYGQLAHHGTKRTAHTLSWRLHRGDIPDGQCVLHECDNRRCANPEHLFLGTRAENLEDMTRKGRRVRGELHGGARLREADVLEIRASDKTKYQLAKDFDVSFALVTKIKTRQLWSHVESP